MAPLTIYYPIRGNAFGLTTGAQYAAFKRRLKVSALMHDRLILDSDFWFAPADGLQSPDKATSGH
jgi:hypothetical protein